MKKRFFALTLAMAMSFSACSNGKPADEGNASAETTASEGKKVLKVITAGGGFWEAPMAKVEEAYEASHPNIDLQLEIYGYDQLFQVIETKVASQSSEYDVISVDAPLVAAYTERGYIKPLDNYISKEEQDKFIDSSKIASIWNNQFMASPLETSAQLLFYNKKLLNEAGITYSGSGEFGVATWEELVEMSNKVLDKVDPNRDQGYAGIALEQVSRPYQILPMANTLGEKGIADDGFTVDGVVNTENWVKIASFYRDLFENKVSLRGVKAEEFGPMFFGGKAVFYIGGPWNFFTASGTEGFEFGYAPFPTFKGYEDKSATPTGSWHFGVSAFSKNEDDAAEFIKYMTLGEGNDVWIKESGDVPALKVSLDKIAQDSEASDLYKMCANDAAKTGYPRPVSPGYSEWENVMTTAFEDIRNGSDPKESLDGAVAQINQLFKKYKD